MEKYIKYKEKISDADIVDKYLWDKNRTFKNTKCDKCNRKGKYFRELQQSCSGEITYYCYFCYTKFNESYKFSKEEIKEYMKEIEGEYISTEEKKKWILENCIDRDGDIDLAFLDFRDFDGDINISHMKVKGSLYQCNQEVEDKLHQSHQYVEDHLYQSNQYVRRNLYQEDQKVQGDLHQYNQNVEGKIINNEEKGGE